MSFGDKVSETLSKTFEPLVDLFTAPIKWAIAWGLEEIMDVLGERLAPTLTPLVDRLEETREVPPELQPILDEIKNPKGEIASLLSYATARGGLGLVTGGLLTTLTSGLDYALKASVQPSLLDPQSIIDAERRGSAGPGFIDQEWLWTGFSADRRRILKDVTRPLLGLQQLMDIYRRYPNQADYVDDTLQQYGFRTADITALKLSWYQFPGIQDLIRMAVREAFSPEIIAKFQTAEDFPEEFAQEAEKQGLTREWALRYWYAHWNLPSIGQGFEMLHRGLIDDAELDVLLRTQDVMPYWRERIKQIAYNPLTRVDVRRMHALGVIDRDQVKRAYMDLGYNDDNAELMTRFTESYNLEDERELTKTEVLQLYKKEALSYEDAQELLDQLGYDTETAAWLLESAQTEVTEENRNLTLSQVKSLALAGFIDKGEATGRLAALGYSAADIEGIYKLWDLEALPNIQMPSRTDLAKFWADGIIDDDTWINEMFKHGYTEEYVSWYYLQMTASAG